MRIPKIPGVQGDVQDLPLISRLVTALQGRPVSNAAPLVGQTLVWNGSQWQPKNVPSGNVTFVGARIRASSTQSVPDSTNTDLQYQTVDFDTDNMANLSGNNRILTFNTAGIYLCICETGWAYSSAGRRINGIVLNDYISGAGVYSAADTRMAIWAPVGGVVRTGNTSMCLLSVKVGDFISSGCFQASGAALNCNGGVTGSGGADAYLSAALWGATT